MSKPSSDEPNASEHGNVGNGHHKKHGPYADRELFYQRPDTREQ